MRDRSYEAKVRVLRERPLVPEMVIGVRDILGTGIWEGEYAVASKGLGSFDISVGLGWGRLASRNPIENPLSTLDQAVDRRPGGRESGVNLEASLGVRVIFEAQRLGLVARATFLLDGRCKLSPNIIATIMLVRWRLTP